MKSFYLVLFFVFFLAASAAAVVNINTASVEELTSLPGIGPVKAESIIKYRNEKGRFVQVEDLKNVYGIGEKIVARIKDDITVGEESSAAETATAATVVKKETAERVEEEEASAPAGKK
ncbi:MAG: helix-hairpin-helix domain-containing protein [Candidatus Electrothrix sp. AUS1_2]|nr:helix-hairpin-helix domain-containing protein [Candidatus Electrothrix sp. AUS1_2]